MVKDWFGTRRKRFVTLQSRTATLKIVRDALDLSREHRAATTVEDKTSARRRLIATLNAMTEQAQRQFSRETNR